MLASAEYNAMADSGNTITGKARLPGGPVLFSVCGTFRTWRDV